MKLRLHHGEQEIDVLVVTAEDDSGYRCEVAGETFRVEAVEGTSQGMVVSGGEGSREVTVARDGERILVALDGEVHEFAAGTASQGASPRGTRSGRVVAPMPGKVLAVLVVEGERVSAGQALVTLEAMKMESTLVAEVPGTVRVVRACAGAMVEGGELLAEIEQEQPT